jgi:flagellar assembly protein FliH
MNLRIIKQGSAKTTVIHPFFFTEEHAGNPPVPYILPESALPGEPDPEPEPIEAVDVEPEAPAIDIEQLEKDAFDRGYAEGRAEGHTEGRAEGHAEGLNEGLKIGDETAAARIEEMTGHYAAALEEVAALKDMLRTQAEEEIVRLALAIANKIVHREIHVDQTIIHTLVRVALERVAGKSVAVVRLSPPDYEYMMRKREDLMRAEGREINFESDGALTQGSCIIQTETGDIDARIEEEFREVENAFFEGL